MKNLLHQASAAGASEKDKFDSSQTSLISALLEEAMQNNQGSLPKPDGGSIQASKLAEQRLSGAAKLEKGVGLKKELTESAVFREKNMRASIETGRSQREGYVNTVEMEELINSEARHMEQEGESIVELKPPEVIKEAREVEEEDSPRKSRQERQEFSLPDSQGLESHNYESPLINRAPVDKKKLFQ